MHPRLTETLSNYQTIILVGGGTGGHIQPILSLAEELPDKNLLWIGGHDSHEEHEAEKKSIEFRSIATLKLSTTKSPKILLYPFILVKGIWKARRILCAVIARSEAIQVSEKKSTGSLHTSRGQKQVCVFSKGGPGSVAIGIAAWSLGIPLYIHESDTIPGRSNRILGKFASIIFLGFDVARKYFKNERCEVVGQILGASFVKEVPKGRKISSGKLEKISPTPLYKEGINWQTTKPHILVICGSQGAKAIFEAILGSFEGNDTYEWIIALGKLNEGMKKEFTRMNDTQAIPWIRQEDIAHLLSDTDIAITRGSATTLAEIDLFGIKKIIIPLPYSAENHQYWNAKEYEKKGDVLLEQKNINHLKEIITKLGQKSPHSSI